MSAAPKGVNAPFLPGAGLNLGRPPFLANLVPPGPPPLPFNQFDWPNPQARYASNRELVSINAQPWVESNFMYPGGPYQTRAPLYTNPYPLKQPQHLTWPNLLTGGPLQPFGIGQYDWPNPLPKKIPPQDWSWGAQVQLIGQDAMTASRLLDFPNPLPTKKPALDWQWDMQQQLIGKDLMAFRWVQTDLPLPQKPTKDWIWPAQVQLIGQDLMAFRQLDWPLAGPLKRPPTDQWVQDLLNTLQFVAPAGPPFLPIDYPNPLQPRRGMDWFWNAQIQLIGKDAMTASRLLDFPNPLPSKKTSSDQQTWFPLTLIGQDLIAFRQLDWPLPLPLKQPAKDWFWPAQIQLIGQDTMTPGRHQTEWPLALPLKVIPPDQWLQLLLALQNPFIPPPPPSSYRPYWPMVMRRLRSVGLFRHR